MAATQITDHAARCLARLITQLRDTQSMQGGSNAFADQIQQLETMLWGLAVAIVLSTAIGIQLDEIGKIVGEARQGSVDIDYLARLRARVLVNRGSGEIETIIQILAIVTGGTVTLTEYQPAAFIATLRGVVPANPQLLHNLVHQAKAAGVWDNIVYELVPDAQIFKFDIGPGFDQGHLAGVI